MAFQTKIESLVPVQVVPQYLIAYATTENIVKSIVVKSDYTFQIFNKKRFEYFIGEIEKKTNDHVAYILAITSLGGIPINEFDEKAP